MKENKNEKRNEMTEINLDLNYINDNTKILDDIRPVFEEKKPLFKTGDKVAYKDFPDICIGYISSDSFLGPFFGIYSIFTSDQWFKHFGIYGGPNTLREKEDDLILYVEH